MSVTEPVYLKVDKLDGFEDETYFRTVFSLEEQNISEIRVVRSCDDRA
jgi:hypothetical protein